ncbi:MAG: hypothetical protein E7243_23470 [Lacrimispora celerecrescens]|nr:hypothetical protein [Lacrimispora celerecrescens]
MIHYGDPAFGGAMYSCPRCGNFKFVAFCYHSRCCPTCGNMYFIGRTTSTSFKIIDVTNRHCVFTIERAFRPLHELYKKVMQKYNCHPPIMMKSAL